jgi:hypothetical protein
MIVEIQVSWATPSDSGGPDAVDIIEEEMSVSEIEDRYSTDDTARFIDNAWRWMNEMYNIPSPTSVKNFELTFVFSEKNTNNKYKQ